MVFRQLRAAGQPGEPSRQLSRNWLGWFAVCGVATSRARQRREEAGRTIVPPAEGPSWRGGTAGGTAGANKRRRDPAWTRGTGVVSSTQRRNQPGEPSRQWQCVPSVWGRSGGDRLGDGVCGVGGALPLRSVQQQLLGCGWAKRPGSWHMRVLSCPPSKRDFLRRKSKGARDFSRTGPRAPLDRAPKIACTLGPPPGKTSA